MYSVRSWSFTRTWILYPILSNLNCSCSASPKAVAFCRIRKWPKSLDALSKTLPFYAKAILERRTTIQIQTVILFSTMLKNAGRIRWTLTHEIGHIYIGHLEVIEGAEIAYNEQRGFYDQFESEADYFAWNLLAPLPILREMGIRSASEIKATYGLSNQAAALQFDRYTKWCRGHVKTAWENGMLRIFRSKYMA